MNIKDLISLIRVKQWYKNFLIFLAIFFVGQFFQLEILTLTIVGFIVLCLNSSAGYIINDIIDLDKDKKHPEKRKRAIASGKIKPFTAGVISLLFLISALTISISLSKLFFYIVLALFLLTQIYSFFLKKIVFADILTIAVLFVLRAISGALLINVEISPWLILCPFFLSLFLSVGKRHSDLLLLKENASKTRKVLQEYNNGITNYLMVISTTLLMISYALYCFLSNHNYLLVTLPFALFVVFRFFYIINQGSIIARHPEEVIKDKEMVIGILLWILITFGTIYL
jgi:4-hydroxybenzoate polyprenyltransferase